MGEAPYLPAGRGRFTVGGRSGEDREIPGGKAGGEPSALMPFFEIPGGISLPEVLCEVEMGRGVVGREYQCICGTADNSTHCWVPSFFHSSSTTAQT